MGILLYIWVLSAAWLILHYLLFHGRIIFHKDGFGDFSRPVSVIICAHNEAVNIRQYLPKVLAQKYPEFEVLVVNDNSTDETEEELKVLSQKCPNLRVVEFSGEKVSKGKKEALLFGIENAQHEHLVFADADCIPSSPFWLECMASQFSKKEIVLGVSPYIFKNNLAGWLTRWETFLTSLQYLSFAKAGMTYMGVGRNLAYSKDVYESSSKMKDHLHIPSGDDDLLISEVACAKNVGLVVKPEAFTYSEAPQTLKEWWRQKRRHLSTSYHYKPKQAFFLGAFGLAQLLFYLLTLPLVFQFWENSLFQIVLWGKLALQLIVMLPFAYKTRQTKALSLFFIIEPFVVFLLAVIHVQNKISGNSKDW